MGFKSGANGIEKKGKTEGKNLGNSGPSVGVQKGGKKSSGVTNDSLKSMGRNMARSANQRGR
jgi:hypothetical protein